MNYVNGYLEGSAPNPTSSLIIVVGTSTSHYYVTYGHGNAWGDMIYGSEGEEIGLRDWLTNLNVEDQVSVVGGIDIEPGDYPTWRVPSVDSLWLSGYADDLPSNNKTHLLYVFGATGGDCPTDYPYEEPRYQPEVNPATCSTVEKPNNDPPTGTTFYTWTQDNFYQLAWDYPVISIYPNIFPIPQIYTQPEYSHPNGRNAEQWYRIGLYSYLKYSSTMGFQGVITQQKACDYFRKDHNGELPPECVGAYLSKAEALQLFKNELNSDPYNRTSSLLANRKTDIGYYFGNP